MTNFSENQIRPSARAVVMHENEILLFKDISDPAKCYVFPGGGIEFTEGAQDALRSELKEEIGVDLDIGRFLGCFEQGFIDWKLGQLDDISLFFLVQAKEKNSIPQDIFAVGLEPTSCIKLNWFYPS